MVQTSRWKYSLGTTVALSVLVLLILWLRPAATTWCTSIGFQSAYPCGILILEIGLLILLFAYAGLWLKDCKLQYISSTEHSSPIKQVVDPNPNGGMRPFPSPIVAMLFVNTLLILMSSNLSSVTIPYQVYGLVFDGTGAYLLALEISDGLLGTQDLTKLPWAFWGVTFLVTGFILQVFAILPWNNIYTVVF